MSEIKYINIEDDRFWQILFDEAWVEGKQAERIQRELEMIAIDEKEITRKPMQEIVERLEEEKQRHKEIAENELNEFCLEMYHYHTDMNHGINSAIEIVKEVGGLIE